MVLEGSYKSKLQDSVQLQTVLALYEQENIRNNEPQSYSRLKTTVRRHMDQTMRTRSFRARNEIVERGAVTKSQEGRKASVERKVGECYQWKASGQCSKGDSCSFSHDPACGNRRDQRREGQSSSPSPAPKAQAQTDRKIPSKSSGRRRESPSGRRGKIPCRYFLRSEVYEPVLPCVSITSLNQGAHMAKNADSNTLRLMGLQQSKKSKKSGVKGSVALVKESIQLGCVSQDSHPRKSIPRKERKLGSNHTVKFSKDTWHHKKNSGKGPSRGVIQKCEPHERNPRAPRFEERTQDETLHQERCARRVARDLAKSVRGLKDMDGATFYSPIEAGATPTPTSKSPEERQLAVDSGASMHMLSKKDLSSDEMEDSAEIQEPTTVVTANGKVQTNEEAQVYVQR